MEINIYQDEEIRNYCKEFVSIDIKIKELKTEIKKQNDLKENIENKILEKLTNHNENFYNFNNYSFKKNKSILNGQIKPEYISEVLLTFVTDDTNRLKELVKLILDKRKITEKSNLKIKKF